MSDSARKILEDTREFLRFRDEMGLGELPLTKEMEKFLGMDKSPPRAEAPADSSPQSTRPIPATRFARPAPPARPKPPAVPANTQPISEIHQELRQCRLCALHETRQQVVTGSGSGSSRLLVITEPPGAVEEVAASPLAGEAGELFDKMLQAIGLGREQIYLTSLVKCRPPDDRAPSATEIRTCLNFLSRQIAAINPLVICGMGPITASILTGSNQPLFQLRGRFHDFHGTPLMVTFHPLFLLRNPEMKKGSWQDLQLLQKKLVQSSR